jgi:formylglycine-generating enzyme required for sulfatase activity
MTGNIWEYCWDWDSTAPYPACCDEVNPHGAATGTNRVGRGGYWFATAVENRVSFRNDNGSYGQNLNCGFRVVLGH